MSANSLLGERSSLSKSKVKLGSRYSVVDAKSKRMAKLFELGGISFDENESLSGPMTKKKKKKKKKKREEDDEARKEANSYEVDIESSMNSC